MMKVSIFIPTLNAASECGTNFVTTLASIKSVQLHRMLVIDSSSNDDTIEVVKSFGSEYIIIPKAEFDHGGTRQLALNMLSDSDIIIYLTQDILIENAQVIMNLVQALISDEQVGGVYGRQVAHQNADIFASHLRHFNYPTESYVRKYNDRFIFGMRCVFSSNSFAAYRVDMLKKIGGFPEHLIMGEDVYIFAKLLRAGYKVAYAANAVCAHSHNYTLLQNFQRYFDIGVFHHAENWILQEFGTANKDGLKYAYAELRFLFPSIWYWPKAILNMFAKYFGYTLGRSYDQLGVRLCRKLSMNQSFWW